MHFNVATLLQEPLGSRREGRFEDEPLAHAEPEDAATPAMSRANNNMSVSASGTASDEMCGARTLSA